MPFLELALGKTVSQIKQRSQQINVLPIGYKVEKMIHCLVAFLISAK